MHRNTRIVLGAVLALACPWLAAQGVYRCGNSYGPQPCPGGSVVATDPAPTAAEAQRSRRAAAADAKRAGELEQARLERERNAPPAVIPPQEPPAPAAKAAGRKKEGKEPGPLTATAPKAPAKPKRQD